MEAILFQDQFVRTLFEKLKTKVKESSSASEVNSLKAQIYGFNSQIDALAKRLFELPKEVTAAPIYKQMGNIEKRKSETLELLDELSDAPETNFLVDLNDYPALYGI